MNVDSNRTTRHRWTAALAAAFAAAVVAAAPAAGSLDYAAGGGADNVVIAQTTANGSSLVRSGTQVATVAGNTVASANIATATASSCTGCHSTAVAVQVLFVTGNPQYYVPSNAAAAVNAGCTSCGSFAYAWQYALQTSGPVALSPSGQMQVAALRRQIAETAASVVPDSLAADLELQAKLDALTSELKTVVDSEVQRVGVEAHGAPDVHVEAQPAQ